MPLYADLFKLFLDFTGNVWRDYILHFFKLKRIYICQCSHLLMKRFYQFVDFSVVSDKVVKCPSGRQVIPLLLVSVFTFPHDILHFLVLLVLEPEERRAVRLAVLCTDDQHGGIPRMLAAGIAVDWQMGEDRRLAAREVRLHYCVATSHNLKQTKNHTKIAKSGDIGIQAIA